MSEVLFGNLPEHKREEALRDNAFQSDHMKYRRYFTEAELAEKHKEFVQVSVEYNREEEEISNQINELREKLKKKKKEMTVMLNIVDKGFDEVEGTVYMMEDQVTGMMSIYDPIGQLIQKRPLKPEERQRNMFIGGASNF